MRTVRASRETAGAHVHYWLVERPNGPTSEATCKLCGATRTFRNSFRELDAVGFRGSSARFEEAQQLPTPEPDILGTAYRERGFHLTDEKIVDSETSGEGLGFHD